MSRDRVRRGLQWAGDLLHAAARQVGAVTVRSDARSLARDGVQVLLIPGVWEPWRFLAPLARRLHAAGLGVLVVPTLGYNVRPVVEGAAAVRARLAECTGTVVLVAHSKGGLVGKRVLLDWATSPANEHVTLAGLVTVSTPWGGAPRARLLPGRTIAELRVGALGIADLDRQRGVHDRIVSIVPAWDPHVPATELEGARTVRIAAEGHFRALEHDATVRAVIDAVRRLTDLADED